MREECGNKFWLPLEKYGEWKGTSYLVFGRYYNAPTLFNNLQKRYLTCRECGTLSTSQPHLQKAPLSTILGHWAALCVDLWELSLVSNVYEWVREWLLFNTSSAIFQLYNGENKLIFNEMKMTSALYYTNMLSRIFIAIPHWNKSQQRDMSPYLDTLSWFRANQSLLLFLNAACFAEKQQIPIL